LPDFRVLLAKSFTSSALGSSPSCNQTSNRYTAQCVMLDMTKLYHGGGFTFSANQIGCKVVYVPNVICLTGGICGCAVWINSWPCRLSHIVHCKVLVQKQPWTQAEHRMRADVHFGQQGTEVGTYRNCLLTCVSNDPNCYRHIHIVQAGAAAQGHNKPCFFFACLFS